MDTTVIISEPVVVIHEPEPEMLAVYMRHLETSHVPVLGVGTHEHFLNAIGIHKPAVALFSTAVNDDQLWRTMLAATASHPALHVVLLTHGGVVSPTESLGTNIAAHLSKQHSSPKEVVRTIINFLTHTNAHV
ncbi:MAG: hypothetical protein IT410_00410 [Candidatus Doudnabacteria bacterium]|nr:hypothetical protein [Candidatus Doudnabacteria bacterium]